MKNELTNAPKTVAALLTNAQFREQISMALPKGVDSKRFLRIVLTEVKKNPKLSQCHLESFASAILSAAQAGLEVGSTFGQCYLIPFKDQCQLILGYRGMIELACKSGVCRNFQTDIVYEGDIFEFEKGTQPYLKHRPVFSDQPKKPVCAYSCATLADGTYKFEVIDMEYINKVKKMSINKPMSKWITDEIEMIKKTAIRYLFKTLPLSPDLSTLIYNDDMYLYGDIQNQSKSDELLNKGKFKDEIIDSHQEETSDDFEEFTI